MSADELATQEIGDSRYVVYGQETVNHADDNSDLSPSDQRSSLTTPEIVIWHGDDYAEAQAIRSGGLTINDVYCIPTKMVDRVLLVDDTTPAGSKALFDGAAAASTTQDSDKAPVSKHDVDQV